jgi:hypothetical protein
MGTDRSKEHPALNLKKEIIATLWKTQGKIRQRGAACAAGIEPGDILLSVDDQDIIPPEHPVFTMGEKTSVEVVGAGEKKRRVQIGSAHGSLLHMERISS